jgi:hypothetical protein
MFGGHFNVTNMKIACIFLMVPDTHVVATNNYWEVDVVLSEFAKTIGRGGGL